MKPRTQSLLTSVPLLSLLLSLVLSGCKPPQAPAPLSTGFRKSALSGLVLQVQNTSDKFLSCKLGALNDTQNQHVVYSFSIDPYKMKEIGIMECNWAFVHGEKILIQTEGYEDLYFTVP